MQIAIPSGVEHLRDPFPVFFANAQSPEYVLRRRPRADVARERRLVANGEVKSSRQRH